MQVTPARHLRAQLDDTLVERIDGRLLLGDLRLERSRLDGELPELEPVTEERAEGRHRDGDGCEDGEGRGPGEVEAEDSGAVAANDEQAELLAARPARAISGPD